MPRRKDRADRDAISLSFYNSKLRDNSPLRRRCSDRHVLDATIDSWKSEERLDGNPIWNLTRSNIIFSLRTRWKLIDSKVAEENAVIWTDDLNSSNNHDAGGSYRLPTIIPASKDVDAVLDKSTAIARTIERIRKSRKELESNRNGVVISEIGWEENIVCRLGVRLSEQISIRNDSHMDFLCTLQDSAAKSRGILIEGDTSFLLVSGSSHSIIVSFLPMNIGVTKSLLSFDFSPVDFDEEDSSINDAFSIVRYISIRAGDPDDYDIIKPIAPFVRKPRHRNDKDKFSNPVREKTPGGFKGSWIVPLGQYQIPGEFGKLIFSKKAAVRKFNELYGGYWDDDDERAVDYPSYLQMDNYAKCLQHLLWVEETQMNGTVEYAFFD